MHKTGNIGIIDLPATATKKLLPVGTFLNYNQQQFARKNEKAGLSFNLISVTSVCGVS